MLLVAYMRGVIYFGYILLLLSFSLLLVFYTDRQFNAVAGALFKQTSGANSIQHSEWPGAAKGGAGATAGPVWRAGVAVDV